MIKHSFFKREVKVSKTRRYINAILIPLATILMIMALIMQNSSSRGLIANIGIISALVSAFLISILHLASAKRRMIMAKVLGTLLLLTVAGIVISDYLLFARSPNIAYVAFPTLGLIFSSIIMSFVISFLGLKPIQSEKLQGDEIL